MLYKTMCGLLLTCVIGCAISQEEQQETENTKRPSWSEGLPERQKAADLNKPEFKPEIDNDMDLDMSEFGLKPKAKVATEIEIGLPLSEDLPAEQVEQGAAEVVDNTPEPVIEQPVTEQPAEALVAEQPAAAAVEVDDAVVTEPVQDNGDLPATAVVENNVNEVSAEEAVSNDVVNNDDAATVDTTTEPVIPVEQSIAAVEPPPTSQELDVAEAAQSKENEYKWSILVQKPVVYPPKAAIDNLEGWVDVEVTIDPAGRVVSASPISYSRKGRVFGKNAIKSVKQWEFAPPSDQGVNTNVTKIYKIEFQL